MTRHRMLTSAALLAASALFLAPAARADKPLTAEQKARHLLDRIGFGPRPGDVERVRAMDLDKYLEDQLHPWNIPDTALDRKLDNLAILATPVPELTEAYRDSRRDARAAKRLAANAKDDGKQDAGAMTGGKDASGAMTGGQQDDAVDPKDGLTQEQRQARRQYQQMSVRLVGELQLDKTMRAVDSNRQLQEVMVDFWTNHFNIDVRKGLSRIWKPADDRDAIRPNALGKFRDLLEASAKSPAMLYYLDNFRSSGPPPQRRRWRSAKPARPAPDRLNENYGRELMELHTLGVDGGYTQKDVIEVARCFTGWTINPQTGEFVFAPGRHDRGEKVVLGHVIPAGGGIEDGEKVLDILAASPATAKHIAKELCMRFVSDDPPASIVDKAVQTWTKTGGDIAAVVRTIVTSPEFYAPEAYRAKVKSPFEYAVSAVRALDGHIVVPGLEGGGRANYRLAANRKGADRQPRNGRGPSIVRQIATMGQPLFQHRDPNGYPEDSRMWLSAGTLVARMNYALGLADGKVGNVQLPAADAPTAGATPEATLDRLEKQILGGDVSAATRAALIKQANDQKAGANATLLTALVLGAPEFQKR